MTHVTPSLRALPALGSTCVPVLAQGLAFGIDTPVKTTSAATPAPGTFIGLPSNINPATLNIAAPYTVVPGGIRIR